MRLYRFYERVFEASANGDAVHADICVGNSSIAFYSRQAAQRDMGFDFSTFDGCGRAVLGFNVPDVDAQYERLSSLGITMMTKPQTYPWGARSFHFRDPDGNIICLRTV